MQRGVWGVHFGTLVRRKIIKKGRKYVDLRFRGSQGGAQEKLQKLPDGLPKSSKTKGSKNERRGSKGAPRGPRGASLKFATDWENRFWERPASKCMLFYRKYNVFQKSLKK